MPKITLIRVLWMAYEVTLTRQNGKGRSKQLDILYSECVWDA